VFLFESLCEPRVVYIMLQNVLVCLMHACACAGFARKLSRDRSLSSDVPCFVIPQPPKQMAGSTCELSATLLAGLSQVDVGLLSGLVQVAGVRAFC